MKLNVKHWTLIALAVLTTAGAFHVGLGSVFVQVAVALLVCLAVDGFAARRKTGKFHVSDSAAITALIVATVLAPNEPWWRVAIVSLVAMLSKHLIRVGPKNLFNPAAFGLALGVLIGSPLSWWGAFSPTLTVIVGSALLAAHPGRWKKIAAFLLTLTALVGLQAAFTDASFIDQAYLVLGASFFFALIMLTDPKSGPIFPRGMTLFGAIVAGAVFLLSLLMPSEMYVGGLLIGNACVPLLNKMRK
jgi:Na+-translocating ferredoxin:NAD+ oxidoreductase RnfD subunit